MRVRCSRFIYKTFRPASSQTESATRQETQRFVTVDSGCPSLYRGRRRLHSREKIHGREDIDPVTKTSSDTRKLIIQDQKDLEYDKLFMTDLTKLCEVRAQHWDQRTRMREEGHALTKAPDILKNQVERPPRSTY